MDHQQVLRDVTVRLPMASTVAEVCQATVDSLARHTPATIAVLLHVHDRLRCVAATGSWQVFATVAPDAGIVGRVYTGGVAAVAPDVTTDPDHIPVRPDVTAEVCVPVPDPAGRVIGVLDVQWTGPADLAAWRTTAERVAARLGARIVALGGPTESRSEKLLRHAAAMTAAGTEWDLMTAAIGAARDVSTLGAAVLVLGGRGGVRLGAPTVAPGELESRIRAELTEAGPQALRGIIDRAHRYGAGYTLGEAGHPPTVEHEPLLRAGVRTLVTVPVGPAQRGGVLLVADDRLLRPDPTTVNLMELLAGQAWSCLDRLRTLDRLREQASSDPLTGLRHTGPFGKRIATATPGRTALLAIDVDGFKTINDTYGHQTGDRVLVGLARALEGALRQGDELYRTGGDEFVAVIEVSRPEEAVRVAERLTEAARRIGRTISVGVALPRPGESPELTLRRADQALYAVKRQGRDGVRLAAA
ncbi:GGDEF domain-containing protein [Micromonospora craniellae]|uniref:GGDEF domain-containing protein n=2 Tax=Micromonospora craniellae TaxID=2294034 RepID=A0A372G1X9_9ACTN|nr:sensor domain-containing diguanylate cyclase [Micromonospora craniellae]QOC95104.1 GGDEF domain-containing protein [Micromonospora craniellae]RFS47055.1 GGDEF domain-containing protein [Micromonospora craniellae]